jgi:hypothetical protein
MNTTTNQERLESFLRVFPTDWVVQRADKENGSITYDVFQTEPWEFLFGVSETDIASSKTIADMIVLIKNEAQSILDRSETLLLYGKAVKYGWKVLPHTHHRARDNERRSGQQGWTWYHSKEAGQYFTPGLHTGVPTIPPLLMGLLRTLP